MGWVLREANGILIEWMAWGPATRDIWQGARIAKMSAAYSRNLRRSIDILRVSRNEVRFVVQSELCDSDSVEITRKSNFFI